ncbi:hypothetical protein IMCC1989_921 [gamma proteobacterium IMCC1989]|nr:hypothetical protein IMCC1989_921 [gamma proteobacterium IMCC1989]
MSDKTPPPLRNYAQMVRVVRDDNSNPFQASVPYQLGKAYSGISSSPGETRIRSLDEIGINSRSPNQLQPPDNNANYSRRESTILYHQLSGDQQRYFDGTSPNIAPTRQDAKPGTKTRTYLDSNAPSESIAVANSRSGCTRESSASGSSEHLYHNTTKINHTNRTHSPIQTHSQPADNRFSHEKAVAKQTQLPFVTRHSLEGTAGNSLDFSLNF